MQLKSVLVLSCVAGLAASASAQNMQPRKAQPSKTRPVASVVVGKDLVPPQNDAEVLWDQSGFDAGLNATVDQDFPDFVSYSTYAVEDFATGDATWNIESVSTYFTMGFGIWDPSQIIEGRLQFYPKTNTLPDNANDIAPEYKVGIRLTDGGGYWIVSADTTGIEELQGISGEYWIGLSPVAAFGTFGQEFHLNIPAFYREIAAIRDPGGAFGFGTDWTSNTAIAGIETSFLLEGTIGGGDECYADCDGDTELSFFDFLCYTNAFNAGDKYADCDGDGELSFFDFLCYTNLFNEGC